MRALFIASILTFALSGCQSAEEKRAAETGEIETANATMDQVAGLTKAARTKNAPQPGIWHTQLHVASVDLSAFEGPARDAQMQALKATERDITGCRSADDLKPFDIDNIEKVAGTCTFPRYLQKGGKLDVEIHCGDGPNKSVMHVTGTSTPTGYDVTIDQVTGVRGAANYLAITLKAAGSRTGNCTSKSTG